MVTWWIILSLVSAAAMASDFTVLIDLFNAVDKTGGNNYNPTLVHMATEWTFYKKICRKNYDDNEDVTRFRKYLTSKTYVQDHNKRYAAGATSYLLSLNKFADMEHSEVLKGRNRYRSDTSLNISIEYYNIDKAPEQSSVDWRQRCPLSQVADQNTCDSSWAIAVASCMEYLHFIKRGEWKPVSSQQLVDCAKENGCSGGDFATAFNYIYQNGGLNSAETYPYTGKEGICSANKTQNVVKLKGVSRIPIGDEPAMLHALAFIGPILAAINASTRNFQLYGGGTFDSSACRDTISTHAVLIVGYKRTADNKIHYIIKNSWGSSWGESGYVKIPVFKNTCGIANEAYVISVE